MRRYELSKDEMATILQKGASMGYYKLKGLDEQALEFLRLEIEHTFQATEARHLEGPKISER